MNQADILHFLEQLGRRYDRQAELHLIGGATLCLFGSPRATLDVDFVGNDLPNEDEFDLERAEIQERLAQLRRTLERS
jgi:hypothetical protein